MRTTATSKRTRSFLVRQEPSAALKTERLAARVQLSREQLVRTLLEKAEQLLDDDTPDGKKKRDGFYQIFRLSLSKY
jgi:hypothetical protein